MDRIFHLPHGVKEMTYLNRVILLSMLLLLLTKISLDMEVLNREFFQNLVSLFSILVGY
jgi:hypothetical protein